MRIAITLLMVNACWFLTTCGPAPTELELVLEAGKIRVVTLNSSTTHYLGAHGPMGFEYDLARGFADFLGVELEIYNADEFPDILQDVRNWRADFAAAGLTVTASRKVNFEFSRPYQQANQLLIYRMGKKRPRDFEDIIGGHLTVTSGSSFVETLLALQLEYPDLYWTEARDASSGEELMHSVAQRELDYTVVDSIDFEINRNYFPELRVAFPLSPKEPLGWVFRRSTDTSLRDAANDYLEHLENSGTLAQLKDRYFGRSHDLDYVGTRQFIRHVNTRLLPYLDWFREAGEQTGIDWQFLAAISYQESHWNRHAVSPTGVRGLMMLTNVTAAQMGVADRTDPREAIFGGARYFKQLREMIPDRIQEPDRTWFALASYNVGFGHLEDARILTQRLGHDPDSWEDVRKHLPLLAQKKWYSQLKRGYARGKEPVIYVDNIRSYYSVLQWAMSDRNPSARWFQQRVDERRDQVQQGGGEIIALP
ncbi:MAG: membrane-bound lytic murein transglycosylase MltF [Gammaproteobacteria bacterium]|nr:membrane-bound lytic murein transglycosylase MltF [Gammaproteobacteria bacterium]